MKFFVTFAHNHCPRGELWCRLFTVRRFAYGEDRATKKEDKNETSAKHGLIHMVLRLLRTIPSNPFNDYRQSIPNLTPPSSVDVTLTSQSISMPKVAQHGKKLAERVET